MSRERKKFKKPKNCHTCMFGLFGNKTCPDAGYAIYTSDNGCKKWKCNKFWRS